MGRVQQEGIIQASRVNAAAHVTQVSLHLATALTSQQVLLTEQCPAAAARLNLIVDNFVVVSATLIGELGL